MKENYACVECLLGVVMAGRLSLDAARTVLRAMTCGVRGFDRMLEKVPSKPSDKFPMQFCRVFLGKPCFYG